MKKWDLRAAEANKDFLFVAADLECGHCQGVMRGQSYERSRGLGVGRAGFPQPFKALEL